MIGRFGKIATHAKLAAQRRERLVVARKARSAIADRALDVFRADARVGADGGRDHIDIRARKMVAHLGEHVGVGDFRRHIGVDGNLGELRIDEVHAANDRVIVARALVDAFEQGARRFIRFADQDEIRAQHVANDGAERDELGVVGEAELGADLAARRLLELSLNFPSRRARHHGRGDDDDVTSGLAAQGMSDRAHRRQ